MTGGSRASVEEARAKQPKEQNEDGYVHGEHAEVHDLGGSGDECDAEDHH